MDDDLASQTTHLDLFSGIGGFALAAQWAGFRTIAFCEIDPYCQKVLAKNFMANAPVSRCDGQAWQHNGGQSLSPTRLSERGGRTPSLHSNIFDFDGSAYRGCDLLTGGFPCQPFSVAGKRRGAADDRHLWPEMLRVIKEARPAWVLGENVPGIIPMELDNVLSDLESIGYAARPFVIPACAVDARHRRDRLWIVAFDAMSRQPINQRCAAHERLDRRKRTVRNSRRSRTDITNSNGQSERRSAISRSERCEWQPEPDVGRVAHGIPKRVDRLKGLGNAIVPQVAFEILREIRSLIK